MKPKFLKDAKIDEYFMTTTPREKLVLVSELLNQYDNCGFKIEVNRMVTEQNVNVITDFSFRSAGLYSPVLKK